MKQIPEEAFESLERVTRCRGVAERAQNSLRQALAAVIDRPYAVFLMSHNVHYGADFWYKSSKSSFKHEMEAIRRATKIRLEGHGPEYMVVIRKWDQETQRWFTLQ